LYNDAGRWAYQREREEGVHDSDDLRQEYPRLSVSLCLLSYGLTPLIRLIAKKTGAMCYPNQRSVHRSSHPVPGRRIAMYLASVMLPCSP
jgi:hypothetical protein